MPGLQPRAARMQGSPTCLLSWKSRIQELWIHCWMWGGVLLHHCLPTLHLLTTSCSSSASLLEPLRAGRFWNRRHTPTHRPMLETCTVIIPNTVDPNGLHSSGQTWHEALWCPMFGGLYAVCLLLPCSLGWNDFLFRAGWGKSIWLSDVPGSAWPAGQMHCQPFPQICPIPGAQAGCLPSTLCTQWSQLIPQCTESSGPPCVTVSPLSLYSSFFYSFFFYS